jgi:hypothetical protein
MLYELIFSSIFVFILIGISFLFNSEKYSFSLVYAYFFIAIFSSIYAWFGNLNLILELFWIFIGTINWFVFKTKRQKFIHLISSFQSTFWVFLLIFIFFSSFAPTLFDYYSYYVPSIKILDEIGLVSGISNLNWSFGQMSFTHIFQATFNQILDVYLRSNLFVIFFFIFYCYENQKFSLLLFLPFFTFFISSPSPDLMVFCLSLLLAHELFTKNKNEFFLLSTLLFITKPTAFIFILYSFIFWIFSKNKSYKILIICCLIISIYLVKNILITSFPLFPLSLFGLDVTWKPNQQILQNSYEVAQITAFDLKYSLEEIENFSFFKRLISWISVSYFNVIIIILTLTSLFKSFLFKNFNLLILSFIILFKFVFLFYFSPQIRFFLDGILIMIFLFLSVPPKQNVLSEHFVSLSCFTFQSFFQKLRWNFVFLKKDFHCNHSRNHLKSNRFEILQLFKNKIYIFLSILALLFFSFIFSFPKFIPNQKNSISLQFFQPFFKNQLITPVFYQLETFNSYKIGNLIFHVPLNYSYTLNTKTVAFSILDLQKFQKWNIFPQYDIEKKIFFHKKLNSSEKQQLKEIIEKLAKGNS